MAVPMISTLTDEDRFTSQQRLNDPHASYNTHLVQGKHAPHLGGDITGLTANDLPYIHADEAHFEPGIAKANVAATGARPHGTTEGDWSERHRHQTVLQQHCSYWDKDEDGIIWPSDTYRGVRAWGWSIPLSLIATLIINPGLSYPTLPYWTPDPFFRIYLGRVHRAKHGSDTMTYDNQGRFRPQAFEEIFANYDRGNKGGLNAGDLWHAWRGQRLAMDFYGWSAFFFEWLATYLLLWPADGILRKEDIRMVYDGSIFQFKADEYAAKQRAKQNGGLNLKRASCD